jgi:hypothetical protein
MEVMRVFDGAMESSEAVRTMECQIHGQVLFSFSKMLLR